MKTSIGSYADDGITLLSNARNTLSAYSPLPHPPAPQPTTVGIESLGVTTRRPCRFPKMMRFAKAFPT